MFTDDTVLHKQVMSLQDAENLQGGDFLQEWKKVYVDIVQRLHASVICSKHFQSKGTIEPSITHKIDYQC